MRLMKLFTWLLIGGVIGAGLWLIIFGGPVDERALARHMQPFDLQSFEQAQASEELILLNFHRSFCPSCQRQKRALARYFIDYPDSDLKVFEIDFNASPDLVQRFRAVNATTFVMFRGEQRIWYNHGQTDSAVIFSALRQAEYHTQLFADD